MLADVLAPSFRASSHLHYVHAGVVEEADDASEDESGACLGSDDEGDRQRRPAPAPAADAALAGEDGPDGLITHAQVLADDYSSVRHVLPPGELKPRRRMPQARVSDFFGALVRTSDGRYVHSGGSGGLNGWPALRQLELRSITVKGGHGRMVPPRLRQVRRLFDAATRTGAVPQTSEQIAAFAAAHLQKGASVRVTLRAPQWSAHGWSARSSGHVFWFDAYPGRKGGVQGAPRIVYGTDLLALGGGEAGARDDGWPLGGPRGGAERAPSEPALGKAASEGSSGKAASEPAWAEARNAGTRAWLPQRAGARRGASRAAYGPPEPPTAPGASAADPRMARCHVFAHRYAKAREGVKDRLTYHAAVLIEWEGGGSLPCTVVELAWLNGLGGYGGKSNFVPDREAERPALYEALPAELQAPWRQERAEVRAIDVPARTEAEFRRFLTEHSGNAARFLEPTIQHSADVRLCKRSRSDLFRALLNYIGRNPRYTQESRNCQTFACDLYRHLSGERAEPFSAVARPLYVNRAAHFLDAGAESVLGGAASEAGR